MKGNCKFCLRYGSECIPHIDCDEIPYTGILADFQIHELIDMGIIEADHAKVQPTSVDLHLGEKFYFENFMGADIVDKSKGDHVKWGVYRMTSTSEDGENHIYLSPGAPCLASVREKVKLPPWLTMELRLTSTEGRDCIQHALAVWCFTADTEVAMWSGNPKRICDVVAGDWVVSFGKDGSARPGLVERSFMSGKTSRMATVTLDNGKVISCTPDHRFMLRNGEYAAASDLKEGDALMPLYQRQINGRRQYYSPIDANSKLAHQYKGRWEYAHRLVHDVQAGYVAHHIDLDVTNDSPDNINVMLAADHIALHNAIRAKGDKHRRRMVIQGAKNLEKARLNPEFIRIVAERGSKNFKRINKERFSNPESREAMRKIQSANGVAAIARLASPENQMLSLIGLIKSSIAKIASAGEVVCADSYMRYKVNPAPTIEKIVDKFGSFSAGLEAAGYMNHKVLGVSIQEVQETPMYDLTIADHHNFALHDACFVHNCDPGFEGCMTLELQNVSQHHTIVLNAGDRICQAVFHKHLPVQKPYHGRYQGDTETSKPKG